MRITKVVLKGHGMMGERSRDTTRKNMYEMTEDREEGVA